MIERRPFGRTGHLSTVTLFGGAALARASQADADRTLDLLLRYGVNHIDTAARYGDSELRIGPWMARHRKDFFLATKTGMRTGREAREDIHRSRSGPTSTGPFTGPSVCPASSSIRLETWRCFPRCWTPRAASSAVPRTTRWRRCSTRRG